MVAKFVENLPSSFHGSFICSQVPQKFRYPFFTEMLWYVLERYVYFLLGTTHLYDCAPNPNYPNSEHIHLTPQVNAFKLLMFWAFQDVDLKMEDW